MQGKKMDPDDSMVGSRPSISVSQENNKYNEFSYTMYVLCSGYLHFYSEHAFNEPDFIVS